MVVSDDQGGPVVIRNGPVLDDGTPMPTRYWLVGKQARLAVDRLEAAGGVGAAEAAVAPTSWRRRTGVMPPNAMPLSLRAGQGRAPAGVWAAPDGV